MADGYWAPAPPAGARPGQMQHQPPLPPGPPPASAAMATTASGNSSFKRSRIEDGMTPEVPPGYNSGEGPQVPPGYCSHEDEKDYNMETRPHGPTYSGYTENGISSAGAGYPGWPGPPPSYGVHNPNMMGNGGWPGWNMGYGGGMPEPSLPPDASCTLYVEGLPANCTRRELAHIFRPFEGFCGLRLVVKEPRFQASGRPLVFCFVDFCNPAQAAYALETMQGYLFDEEDPESAYLRLQFARNSGPKPGGTRFRY